MVLSIGMIVKNEEKYLGQCLTALKPLLEAVESELIIVDTGSTDRTVEIAREFTDKVLFFEWINDFSAARNVSLKAATGEWFMFVDADEVFQSCDDLIEFFNSGEYKNYGSGYFVVRSYGDLNNRANYTDCYVPRMVKREPSTEFVGEIHERLNPMYSPKRIITDVADHYGYVFTDNLELKNEKFERNSKLLLERLEASNGDPSADLCKELFDTFNFLEDKTEAVKYAYMGIERATKDKSDYVMALYYSLAFMYFTRLENEKLLEVYDEYFAVDPAIRVKERSLDVEFYGFKAIVLYRLNRYEEAYHEFHKFYTLDSKFEREGICTREALYVMRFFANKNMVMDLNLLYTETCLKLKKYKDAEDNFKKHAMSKFEYSKTVKIMRLNQMIDYLRFTGAKALANMYNNLEDNNKKLIFDAIRFRLPSWEKEEQRSMINKLVAMNFKNPVYNKIVQLHKEHLLGDGAGIERTTDFINSFGAAFPDLLYIMLKEQQDISLLIKASPDISNEAMACYKNIEGFTDVLNEYNHQAVATNENLLGLTGLYLQTAVCIAESKQEISTHAEIAGSYAMKYLDVFGEADIPDDVMAAIVVEQIRMLRGMRNYKECIALLRQLIQINKKYAPIAKTYQALLKEDMGS